MEQTIESLKLASKHLHYEFSMFNSLAQIMAMGIFGPGVLNNAILESFTLHARVLLAFLYSENPRDDDVSAENFFDKPGEWLAVRPDKTEQLRLVHKRVGKEVAHLTYARQDINAEQKQWHFPRIANDLNNTFAVFLTHVNKEKLDPIWESIKIQTSGKNSLLKVDI